MTEQRQLRLNLEKSFGFEQMIVEDCLKPNNDIRYFCGFAT